MRKIIVQKFGGTSLRNQTLRTEAIRQIKKAKKEGYQVVVVVSAMGRKGEAYATDSLLELIKNNGNSISARERDLLLCCGEIISSVTFSSLLQANQIPAVALTGWQAGILTNNDFNQAQIEKIQPKRILEELDNDKVVVVCGFQGGTKDGEYTTLGRGGSDTTATALGAGLQAEFVDIFTDVDGIMTADPKIVEDARALTEVTYTEICNFAYQGAKVIHPRAVEIAMQANIPIRVRATTSDGLGTLVTSVPNTSAELDLKDKWVTGIAHVPRLTQIKVYAKEGEYVDLQLKIFKAMAENKISVDFINVNPSGVAYTVFEEVAERAVQIIEELGYIPKVEPSCAKVSTIGAAMSGVPGIMAYIITALTSENIRILQSADSYSTIWVLVKEKDMEKAVMVLHKTFNLHHQK